MSANRLCTGLFLVAGFVMVNPAGAEPVHTEVNAEYRPRLEVDKRFGPSTGVFITHRARVGFGAERGDWRVYIAPQDVRAWGSEAHTASYEANVDLHQGFVQWSPDESLTLRIGRQSIAHLNQRLIGGLNWAQQGRSFDAVRLSGKVDKVTWDLWGAPLQDDPPLRARNGAIGTAHVRWDHAGRTVAALGIGDLEREASLYRWTTGVHTRGKLAGPLTYQAEGYYQFGHQGGERFSAYLLNGELGVALREAPLSPVIRVGYDVVSGDTESTRTFDTLHATNHAFYGFMDAFMNLPAHTGGRGLQDVYVRATATIDSVRTYLAVHHLMAGPGHEGTFGTEVDMVVTVPLTAGVIWETGAAALFAGDAFADVRPDAQDIPLWGYSMLTASLR